MSFLLPSPTSLRPLHRGFSDTSLPLGSLAAKLRKAKKAVKPHGGSVV